MTLHGEATLALQLEVDRRQAKFDIAATETRAANLQATRLALANLVDDNHVLRSVAELLACSLTIGREGDGYPVRECSEEAKDYWRRAVRSCDSGLDQLGNRPVPDLTNRLTEDEQNADYKAWSAAADYRKSTAVDLLSKR